jgi:hypothetical protein
MNHWYNKVVIWKSNCHTHINILVMDDIVTIQRCIHEGKFLDGSDSGI